MEFVSRREWGAAAARGSTVLQPARVTMFVLHHTTGTYAGHQTVRNIQAFHQGPQRNWADVGYNFLIAPDGTIFEGRGWGMQGAHARGHNAESIGVAYIGDGRKPVPDAAKFAILRLAAEADRLMGKPLRRVGHRDVGATACPGDVLYGWWAAGPSLPVAAPDPVVEPEPKPEPEPTPPPSPAPSPLPSPSPAPLDSSCDQPRGPRLPNLPAGLRWGHGGLPRIPWLRGR